MSAPTTTTEMKIGMTFPSRIAVFDTETTDPDPREARIVSCFIGIMDTATGELEERWTWLVNPGVEIPAEASAIHGISTEKARDYGMPAQQAAFEISQRLDIIQKRSLAIVAMNAVYDFTVLDRELLRYWPAMRPLIEGRWEVRNRNKQEWIAPEDPWGYDPAAYEMRWRVTNSPVIFDPMVLDRAFDKYRAGSRKLVDLAEFYGVPVRDDAHDAEADCIMAGQVAVKLLQHSKLQDLSLSEVHDKIIPTKRNQAIDLEHFWRTKKLPRLSGAERVDMLARIKNVREVGHYWPLIPRDLENGEQK
jgi:DNA polymerase-3 subunit epsilon